MSPSACEGLPRNRLYGRSGAAPFPRPPWWPPCGRTGSCTGAPPPNLASDPAVDPLLLLLLLLLLVLLLLLSPLPGRPVAPLPRCPVVLRADRPRLPWRRVPRAQGEGSRARTALYPARARSRTRLGPQALPLPPASAPWAYGPGLGLPPLPPRPRPPGPPLAARLGPLARFAGDSFRMSPTAKASRRSRARESRLHQPVTEGFDGGGRLDAVRDRGCFRRSWRSLRAPSPFPSAQ